MALNVPWWTKNHLRHNDSDMSWIPAESIKRIEVVRGIMSSLYDSDALGGYSIWNTGGSYKVSKTVKIRAGVLNLTDKNLNRGDYSYNEDGSRYFAAVDYSFWRNVLAGTVEVPAVFCVRSLTDGIFSLALHVVGKLSYELCSLPDNQCERLLCACKNRVRQGLSTNNARPAVIKSKVIAQPKTRCQLWVC